MPISSVSPDVRYPLPIPEPGVFPDELVARAASFRQALRDAQVEDDARGCHSEAMEMQFRKAGFTAFCSLSCSVVTNTTSLLSIVSCLRLSEVTRAWVGASHLGPRIAR